MMKEYSLNELQLLYENEEYKRKIDRLGLKKHCTGGSGDSKVEGFRGCGGRLLPLYEFPVIKQYKKNAHNYKPDDDGVMRRDTCRDCLREYNNLVARQRRSQVFDKEGALAELHKYIASYLKTDPSVHPIYVRVSSDPKDQYKFTEVENIKQEAKTFSV